MQVTTDTRIQTMHFGPNGHLLRPRSAFTSKPLNTLQTVLEPIQQPVTIDIPAPVAQPPVPASAPRRVLPLTRDYAPIVIGRDKKESRFLARSINERYSEYKSGRISLEILMTHIANFIIHGNNDWGIDSFLIDIQPSLGDGTFHRSKLKFSTKLKKEWATYRQAAFPDSDKSPEDTIEAYCACAKTKGLPVPRYERYLRTPDKHDIVSSYVNLMQGQDDSQNKFLEVITDFAYCRIRNKFASTYYAKNESDDLAQDVVIKVANAIDNFEPKDGDPAAFYPWFKRIVFTVCKDGLRTANKRLKREISFFTTGREFDNDQHGYYPTSGENSEIGSAGKIKVIHNGRKTYLEPRVQTPRELPEFIQGVDLKICKYIRAGHDYANIGRILEMTEASVKMHVRRMNRKYLEMNSKETST